MLVEPTSSSHVIIGLSAVYVVFIEFYIGIYRTDVAKLVNFATSVSYAPGELFQGDYFVFLSSEAQFFGCVYGMGAVHLVNALNKVLLSGVVGI